MTRKKKMVRTDMQTYLDIFRLKFEAKLSDRQISQALNIGRATISDLVIRFNNLGLSWPLAADYPLDSLDKQLFPGRDYSTQRVLPSWVQVHLELRRKGVTKLLLWQEYRLNMAVKPLATRSTVNITGVGVLYKNARCDSIMKPVRSCLSTSVARQCRL